jgi:hypothetical protein
MSDWIGLAVIVFLVLCGLAGLSALGKPYDVSTEEFERRAKEGPGLLGAGLVGLQKALDPAMERAVEAQEDLKRGRYNKEDGSGDPPDAGDLDREVANDNTGAEPEGTNNTDPGRSNA